MKTVSGIVPLLLSMILSFNPSKSYRFSFAIQVEDDSEWN